MPLLISLGATLGLLVVMTLLGQWVPPAAVIALSALWAAWDSSRIGLVRYKTGIAYSPLVLFFAVALLWLVGFPWYLFARQKIRRGEMPLKQGQGRPAVAAPQRRVAPAKS